MTNGKSKQKTNQEPTAIHEKNKEANKNPVLYLAKRFADNANDRNGWDALTHDLIQLSAQYRLTGKKQLADELAIVWRSSRCANEDLVVFALRLIGENIERQKIIEVEFLYRDAHNYKTFFKVDLPDKEAKKLTVGQDIEMGEFNTPSKDSFFETETHPYPYNDEYDHNILEVISIDGKE